MERRAHLRQLRDFADIREAQKRTADARLAAAERNLRQRAERLVQERDHQAARSEAWIASVAKGRLDLQQAWAQSLREGEAAVAQAARASRRAEARREEARAESQAAEAKREATETVVTAAARRARRRRDEAIAADLEELFARRRAP